MRSFLFIIAIIPSLCLAQTREDVLRDYFHAIGGMEKWKEVQSSRVTSTIAQNLNFLYVEPGTVDLTKGITPSEHFTVSMLPDLKYTRVKGKDGNTTDFYINNRKSVFVAYDKPYDFPFSFEAFDIDIAVGILELSQKKKLNFVGEVTYEDSDYWVLEGPRLPQIHKVKYLFNKTTHLLEVQRFDYSNEPRYVVHSDFREVDGLLVSYRREAFNNNVLFERQVTTKIELNPVIDKSIFYYTPASIPEVIDKKSEVFTPLFEDGDLSSLVDKYYKGRRVFIDLWATWCAPCKTEIMKYDSGYYETMRKFDVTLIFISIDKESDRKKWEYEINKYELKGDHFFTGPRLLKSLQDVLYKNPQMSIPRYILSNEQRDFISQDFMRPSKDGFFDKLSEILGEN